MTLDEEKELERFRQDGARALEEVRANAALFNDRTITMQRAVLEYAQIMVRSVILANGVTSTAIIAYLGDATGNAHKTDPQRLGIAAAVAATGVGFGVLATMFAYFSQWSRLRKEYEVKKPSPLGDQKTRTWGLASVSASLLCFLLAVALAVSAMA